MNDIEMNNSKMSTVLLEKPQRIKEFNTELYILNTNIENEILLFKKSSLYKVGNKISNFLSTNNLRWLLAVIVHFLNLIFNAKSEVHIEKFPSKIHHEPINEIKLTIDSQKLSNQSVDLLEVYNSVEFDTIKQTYLSLESQIWAKKERIVISFTTLCKRNFIPVINSLLEQKWNDDLPFHFDTIHINIPHDIKFNFNPVKLPPNVSINRSIDFGPATKYYPILNIEKDENTIIFICDDDVIYPPYHFSNLLEQYILLDQAKCLCASGFNWNHNFVNFDDAVKSYGKEEGHGKDVYIIEAFCGLILKVGWFDKSWLTLLNQLKPEQELYFADDLTISTYLHSRGVHCKNINLPGCNRFMIKHLDNNDSLNNRLDFESSNMKTYIRNIFYCNRLVANYTTIKSSLKIAVITMAIGEEYTEKISIGLKSKQEYCSLHGYDLIVGGEELYDKDKPVIWTKISMIQKYLPEYDFIFYSDGDVIITNHSIKIEHLIEREIWDSGDIFISQDINGINIGQLIVKNTSWTRSFLTHWYNHTPFVYRKPWYEQAGLVYLLFTNDNTKNKVKVLKQEIFNSYLHNYKTNHFLIHLAGIYDDDTGILYKILKNLYGLYNEKITSEEFNLSIIQPYLTPYTKNPNWSEHLILKDLENKEFVDVYLKRN